jgi:hypothetical protein
MPDLQDYYLLTEMQDDSFLGISQPKLQDILQADCLSIRYSSPIRKDQQDYGGLIILARAVQSTCL